MMILPTSNYQLTTTFPRFDDQAQCRAYVRELFADHAYAMLVPRDHHHNKIAMFTALLGCLTKLPDGCTFGDSVIQLEIIPHYYHEEPQWDLIGDVKHHDRNQSFVINHRKLADALWHAQSGSNHHT